MDKPSQAKKKERKRCKGQLDKNTKQKQDETRQENTTCKTRKNKIRHQVTTKLDNKIRQEQRKQD